MSETFEVMRSLCAEYEKARAAVDAVTLRIDTLFSYRLTDYSHIPQLHEWYCQTAKQSHFSGDAYYGNNKQFLLVVLMLYSPRSLFGGPINSDLRHAFAAQLGLRADTFIYRMRDKAIVWNQTYRTFSSEVAIAYNQIILRLEEHRPAIESSAHTKGR